MQPMEPMRSWKIQEMHKKHTKAILTDSQGLVPQNPQGQFFHLFVEFQPFAGFGLVLLVLWVQLQPFAIYDQVSFDSF